MAGSNFDLLASILETQKALDLFLNNDFQQAKSMTAPLAGTSIYHSLGYSAILYLQAVMTFDAGDIEAAVGATKRCLDL